MKRGLPVLLFFFSYLLGSGQSIDGISLADGRIHGVNISEKFYQVNQLLFSYELDGNRRDCDQSTTLQWKIINQDQFAGSLRLRILFINTGADTIQLSNVVPMGAEPNLIHLTGQGKHRLSRAHLFLPGKTPVNVIVPDNAWELGFSTKMLNEELSIYALSRREVPSIEKGMRRRFETELYPGGSVQYLFYFESFAGSDWRKGLSICFQERKLFDVTEFDQHMYQRADLQWIKKSYVMHLLMAWDERYYSSKSGQLNLTEFVNKGRPLYGGDEVVCLWPTWPSLGLDQRNQFDLYRDLPGGISALRSLSDTLRSLGTKFFIAYNPWDEGTRKEDHLIGLEKLIRDTGADGVVLDTRGNSSKELQEAADRVRPGVVMYSEGMAVPSDMHSIVSGRVHNALYYPPMLNLNKLIQPSFAIFRVAEVFKEPIQREYATAFFNGYGTEINQFAPGHPDWEEEQYRYLGKTSMILRENTSNFTSKHFVPLVSTLKDSIWVNQFSSKDKTLYTIYSFKPEGFKGLLFEVSDYTHGHWVDLWQHQEIIPVNQDGKKFISVDVEGFSKKWLGTNNEGQNGAVAFFPELLKVTLQDGQLIYSSTKPGNIRMWTGSPDYSKKPYVFKSSTGSLPLRKTFGDYEGRIVIQVLDDEGELMDERVMLIEPGTPILVSQSFRTSGSVSLPKGMVRIPGGSFKFRTTHGDEFIRYPKDPETALLFHSFYMDRFPVTNREYEQFIKATGYHPSDSVNFLKHWSQGKPKPGEEQLPVVNVSFEDAKAYAQWRGKRLPTEAEWQFAAQTPAGNEWPWKQSRPVTREKQFVNETLTTTKLVGVDPKMTNIGDDRLHPVGDFPKGVNPYGLQDLVGSVWHLTNDEYESGSYRYIIMKGGSYFKPSASWWYVQGGPRELHYRQYLLRVSPGFERNSTVGFRCVKDY